ncbi:MAG: class I SAM-dependent methyltransferase [Anaerolineaceae bacterium]|nr:class I SAM-dependent methyltransferase [Anaerolineaceae bacterium]
MFKRKVELHQEEAFAGLEAAKEYAESAQKSTMKYQTFLSNLKTLSIQGKYLDVGAGTGNLAAIIAQNNPDVEIAALEISTDMMTVGEEYIRNKGLQGQIRFIKGDAFDKETTNGLGKFDLIYSTFSLHHWKNPRQVIDNLMSNLSDNGVLYLYDLRRVWWLYWVPIHNGFFNSIRAAYVRREIKEMLTGFRPECYEIRHEFPFMQSVVIRKSF